MTKRIVDYDPLTGVSTAVDYDPASDITIVSREQDVERLLEQNKLLQNDDDVTRRGIKECWWLYCRFPAIVIEKWLNEDGINVFNKDHWKAVIKKVNQPEYRYLKTTTKMHAR